LIRLGVPIYNSHTILNAFGKDAVEGVVIAEIDKHFKTIPGSPEFIIDPFFKHFYGEN